MNGNFNLPPNTTLRDIDPPEVDEEKFWEERDEEYERALDMKWFGQNGEITGGVD